MRVAPARPGPTAAPAPAASPPSADRAAVAALVRSVLSDKTGYDASEFEDDDELEADLGVDTVKQAETFAAVREAFDIPRADTLQLRDFPTMKHVIGFVQHQNLNAF